MNKENVKKFNESQNVDAKAAKVREKLENESLDKCKVAGGEEPRV